MTATRIWAALATGAALFMSCTHSDPPAAPPVDLAECQQTKDLDRAIAACTSAIETAPKMAEAYSARGFAYFLKADYDRSFSDHNQAIRLNPRDATAFQRRGITFRARGEDNRAIADFTQAIKLGSTDLNVYIDRGMTHLTRGDFPRAIADFATAIDRDADKTFVGQLGHIGRGLALIYSGAPDKAQADLKRATELNPKEPFFAMFLHVAELRASSDKAKGNLATAAVGLDMTKWPADAIRMFLGEWSYEDVLDMKAGPVTTCEADYFVGEHMLFENRKDQAIRLFRKAQTDCPRYILERVAAGAALRALGLMP